jgi:hypothetical protein
MRSQTIAPSVVSRGPVQIGWAITSYACTDVISPRKNAEKFVAYGVGKI